MRCSLWMLPVLIGCAGKGPITAECPDGTQPDVGGCTDTGGEAPGGGQDSGGPPQDTGGSDPDTGRVDTGRMDTGRADSGTVDSGTGDTGSPDTGDSGLVDTAAPPPPPVDLDGDGFSIADGDCDDDDAAIHPLADEICDTVDNNCDDDVDEGVEVTWYLDFDGDGHGSDAFVMLGCSPTFGYVASADDCDDTSDASYPGAEEICDEEDNNCDGEIDEDLTHIYFFDGDHDGFGDVAYPHEACSLVFGYADNDEDCDDGDAAIHPDATERCDAADNDCDGSIDEDSAADASTWFSDGDRDGFGDAGATATACAVPEGFTSDSTDCDDGDAAIHPDATEVCDEADNDCDGSIDEDSATDAGTWFSDGDRDGFGDAGATATACAVPEGFTSDSTDCDDGDAAIHPDATEVCDEVDNDCDGSTDEDVKEPFYADSDGDGHGTTTDIVFECSAPSGYAETADDCDDADGSIHPDATEVCDESDNDCDGEVDEGVLNSYYADVDGDGYGAGVAFIACAMPTGFVETADDCLDTNSAVHPGISGFLTSSYMRTPGSYSFDYNCDGVEEEELVDLAVIPDGTFWEHSCDGFSAGWAIDHVPACGAAASFNWSCDIVILPGGSGYRRLTTTMPYQACR